MKKEHIIQIDSTKCTGCCLCKRDCPANNIAVEHNKARVITTNCIMCGHCVAVCPKGAVSMTGFDEPPMEIKKPARLEPQQLLEVIRTRRSIRQFTKQPIASEIITHIIEAGRLSPTGKNAQDVSYILLQDEINRYKKIAVRLFRRLHSLIKLVNPAARRTAIDEHFFFKSAPVAIMVVSRDKVNGTLAASNMALMAEACHLGVLYNGFFSFASNCAPSLRKALGLKGGDKVVTTLVLGYPNVKYHRTAQREPASIRQL